MIQANHSIIFTHTSHFISMFCRFFTIHVHSCNAWSRFDSVTTLLPFLHLFMRFDSLLFSLGTRWDELKKSVQIIVDIAAVLDPNGLLPLQQLSEPVAAVSCCVCLLCVHSSSSGVDVYFLNKEPLSGIRSSEQVVNSPQFQRGPEGSTPLGKVLQRVLQEKSPVTSQGRNLLIVIMTDGLMMNFLSAFIAGIVLPSFELSLLFSVCPFCPLLLSPTFISACACSVSSLLSSLRRP